MNQNTVQQHINKKDNYIDTGYIIALIPVLKKTVQEIKQQKVEQLCTAKLLKITGHQKLTLNHKLATEKMYGFIQDFAQLFEYNKKLIFSNINKFVQNCNFISI